MEHRRTTAALTTSPHGLANDVSINTHTPSTHTHTSYHRTPFTTIHLLHHNLPAQPAPPPDPPHDRLSPRPPPVSSPPPMHGCSKTVSSVRCFVIGFLLAAHLPSSRARTPAHPPRAGGADLRSSRASSDTLLATACSRTCRATIPTLRLHIIKDTARPQFTVAPGTHPLNYTLHSYTTTCTPHTHDARLDDATRLRADIHAQRNDAAKTAKVASACRGGEGEGERQGSGETLVLGGEGYGGGAMTAAAPRGWSSYLKDEPPAHE